jgi:hypothetical protein
MNAGLALEFLRDVLACDGLAWVTAVSWSMAPLIRPGDALRVAPIDAATARAGAIVAYQSGAQLIVHRIVATTREGVVTRGDGLPDADEPLAWLQVVGRVTAIRTASGRTLDLERPPWTILEPALGWLAGHRGHGWLAWKARRLPFHAAATLLR